MSSPIFWKSPRSACDAEGDRLDIGERVAGEAISTRAPNPSTTRVCQPPVSCAEAPRALVLLMIPPDLRCLSGTFVRPNVPVYPTLYGKPSTRGEGGRHPSFFSMPTTPLSISFKISVWSNSASIV